jgi:hypothetical protein
LEALEDIRLRAIDRKSRVGQHRDDVVVVWQDIRAEQAIGVHAVFCLQRAVGRVWVDAEFRQERIEVAEQRAGQSQRPFPADQRLEDAQQ